MAVMAMAANSALAKGPPPPATATASLSQSGVGPCPGTATVTWKNLKGGVMRIDYTFSGGVTGGAFSNFGSAKSGSDVQDVSVASGASFSFTAKLYADLGGSVLQATVTSTNSPACNA
jgi:hypothetical protein